MEGVHGTLMKHRVGGGACRFPPKGTPPWSSSQPVGNNLPTGVLHKSTSISTGPAPPEGKNFPFRLAGLHRLHLIDSADREGGGSAHETDASRGRVRPARFLLARPRTVRVGIAA